jgi:hypothetical protein
MQDKQTKVNKGVSFYQLQKELKLTPASVRSLINKGQLKLNDYDKIDEESYLKFKENWKDKPAWMKRTGVIKK